MDIYKNLGSGFRESFNNRELIGIEGSSSSLELVITER